VTTGSSAGRSCIGCAAIIPASAPTFTECRKGVG
jgi:hypothetical protein